MSTDNGAIATAWRLALIAAVVVAAVVTTTQLTAQAIADNQRAAVVAQLAELTGVALTANDVPANPSDGFIVCAGGEALAVERDAAQGYGGTITLLIARDARTLRGVRVVHHTETPGIGDVIKRDRSPWIEQFTGKALATPEAWHIDSVTGATITTRAVVSAVARHVSTAATMSTTRCGP